MSSSVKKYTIGLKDLILEGDIDKVIAHSTPSLTKLQFANLSFSLTIRITKTARERKRVRNKPRKEIVFSRLIALVFNTHCHWSEVSGRSIWLHPQKLLTKSVHCYVYPRKREFTQTITSIRKIHKYICDLLVLIIVSGWEYTGYATFSVQKRNSLKVQRLQVRSHLFWSQYGSTKKGILPILNEERAKAVNPRAFYNRSVSLGSLATFDF